MAVLAIRKLGAPEGALMAALPLAGGTEASVPKGDIPASAEHMQGDGDLYEHYRRPQN